MPEQFDIRLAQSYATLSEKLQQAADYVVSNPVDVATRSLRYVAQKSDVAPATYSRLARALEYENFEALRDVIRDTMNRRVNSFSQRAKRLQSEHKSGQIGFAAAHMEACITNIRSLAQDINPDQLEETVARLSDARKVLLVGALGSRGVTEHMAHMAGFLTDDWKMADSLGSGLVALDPRDALIVISKPPFAQRALNAAELARENGVFVVVMTDTHACPALRHASTGFIIPTESPHFQSSYTATVFLIETILGMLADKDANSRDRITKIETINRRLHEVADDTRI
ncbi:MurR/RpiR family transcriptional regulator [Parasulfitobacter algicola]|uniref:MurR/RpiR family transcriptional regulator n=1 Tax=Parasulfitobacter algicola TaxID=2614809 RepID=A0ABX2IU46_9RHOB|nr:MurR/RpiR family transcriptional regulator [Sulfitobacter algicola]NSX54352.1 MurR/RpiR family transcriptional regulator [Sulfitobacter algicola]